MFHRWLERLGSWDVLRKAVMIYLIASISRIMSSPTETTGENCVKWAGAAAGGPFSQHLRRDCTFDGQPVCCGLLESPPNSTPDKATYDNHFTHVQHQSIHNKLKRQYSQCHQQCSVTKTYVPSPYEKKHFEYAKLLDLMPEGEERKYKMISLLFDDLPHANIWLQRVHDQMHKWDDVKDLGNPSDEEYLSKFVFTATCDCFNASNSRQTAQHTITWNEYIEPITISMRHPMTFLRCTYVKNPRGGMTAEFGARKERLSFIPNLMNADYVLLRQEEHIERERYLQRDHNVRKNVFLDAGTSSFDSSLSWFLCQYLDASVCFHAIYGWEYSLIEPKAFWHKVPPLLSPHYHFYNAPVTADNTSSMSATRLIQQIAHKHDFVSFKLDIDTPDIELAMVRAMIDHRDISDRIDEFFFELHFRCEIMMRCGWGNMMMGVPAMSQGFNLTSKYDVANVFRKLRERGIRSHAWV